MRQRKNANQTARSSSRWWARRIRKPRAFPCLASGGEQANQQQGSQRGTKNLSLQTGRCRRRLLSAIPSFASVLLVRSAVNRLGDDFGVRNGGRVQRRTAPGDIQRQPRKIYNTSVATV